MSGQRQWVIASAVIAVVGYALLWLGYAHHWAWMAAVDSAALDPLHDYGVKHPAWVKFWDVLCAVLAPNNFRIFGLVVIVIALLRRNVRAILFMLTALGMSGIVTQLAKELADRPRPASAVVGAASTSFPSGHALGAMAAVLALLTITWGLFGRRTRTVLIVVGAVTVIAVSAGRVVLNVHYPSDVLAGWALGYLWYLCCLLVIRPKPLSREAADNTPSPAVTGSPR